MKKSALTPSMGKVVAMFQQADEEKQNLFLAAVTAWMEGTAEEKRILKDYATTGGQAPAFASIVAKYMPSFQSAN